MQIERRNWFVGTRRLNGQVWLPAGYEFMGVDIAYINDRVRQISARIQSAEEDELNFLVLELDLALRQHAWYVRTMVQGTLGRLPSPKSEH